MQTNFSLAALANPQVAESEKILRACVHCGFCTATCPTYVLLGDELDSPRGRIYLIKEMLENDQPATREVVKHVDRCLSCLSCMTTCPSGVHYQHLVDHARDHIEKTYNRPLPDRLMRGLLAYVLTNRSLFRMAVVAGKVGKPFAAAFAAMGLSRVAAMLRLTPATTPAPPSSRERVFPATGERKGRVALLGGCISPVLSPSTNEAAIRVLNRHGIEAIITADGGCCGSLTHHMGREEQAMAQARATIDAFVAEMERDSLDAILVTVSGCGTTIKDYGFMFRNDPAYADKARAVSALAKDISEYVAALQPSRQPSMTSPQPLNVAYHAACSLQHGQKVVHAPKELLSKLGFIVKDVGEGHLCCGSAGTYNILQPAIASKLRDRKVGNIEKLQPDVIAAGNIGCMTQIASGTTIPVVHTVELVDWATGGPMPEPLARLGFSRSGVSTG